jgi:hypothetical protein
MACGRQHHPVCVPSAGFGAWLAARWLLTSLRAGADRWRRLLLALQCIQQLLKTLAVSQASVRRLLVLQLLLMVALLLRQLQRRHLLLRRLLLPAGRGCSRGWSRLLGLLHAGSDSAHPCSLRTHALLPLRCLLMAGGRADGHALPLGSSQGGAGVGRRRQRLGARAVHAALQRCHQRSNVAWW